MRSDLDVIRERQVARELRAELAAALAEGAWGWAADFHSDEVGDVPPMGEPEIADDDFDF